MSVTTPHPVPPRAAAATGAVRAALCARRNRVGASLGALPVANVVVIEIGLALGLLLLAVDSALLPVSGAVLLLALVIAFIRWGGRWFTQWVGLTVRYLFRSHSRVMKPGAAAAQATTKEASEAEELGVTVIGPEDRRVALLRLTVPDLVVTHTLNHEREEVGLAWHQGKWTAVLQVDTSQHLITNVNSAPNLPLGALAPCLEDRGVVLDAIKVIWHCYPGSLALPPSAPAYQAYLELLGTLPAAARRATWITLQLDPRRCGTAVRERGGGVVGAHRAMVGALSRVRSALASRGVVTRPLSVDELLRAGLSAAELVPVLKSEGRVTLRERWGGVTAGGIGHSSYVISGWPSRGAMQGLNTLTGVRALSSTVVLSITPSSDATQVGLRGLVRVSARTPSELTAADQQLTQISGKLGITLTSLRGMQLAGLVATLPVGGAA